MFAFLCGARKLTGAVVAMLSLVWLAACGGGFTGMGGGGPTIDTSKPVPVALLLLDLAAGIEEELPGLEVVQDVSLPRGLRMNLDVDKLRRAVSNVAANARDAMPTGGTLSVVTGGDADTVYVEVTDTGTGMDETTRQRVFDPFFTTKEKSRGTGLGLASAYGIIKNHNGMIDVASNKGRGSTFTIYLPRTKKEFPEEKAPVEKAIKGRETILLVDDEEMVADVGQKMLQKLDTDYKDLKAGAAEFLTLKKKYKEVSTQLAEQTKRANELDKELSGLEMNQYIKWFLAGSGVLLVGFIIGFSAKRGRRRPSLM